MIILEVSYRLCHVVFFGERRTAVSSQSGEKINEYQLSMFGLSIPIEVTNECFVSRAFAREKYCLLFF